MKEVTIAEAAKSLGLSQDSIRRRISKGDLKARMVSSPHGDMYLIELPDDIPQDPAPVATKGTAGHKANDMELEALRNTISILETELEARRREVSELHVLLQQAQAALPPGRGHQVKVSFWRRLWPWGKS